MIEITHTDVYGWEAAVRGMSAKGYRRTKNGKYECIVSDRQKTIILGTYETKQEAIESVFNFRKNRLISAVGVYALNLNDCRVYKDKYLVFKNGMIFNLHGHLMRGALDRNGYRHGLLDGKNTLYHRVIAELFYHKDGDKQNNCANNLEWVTRSENARHSFKNGLQKVITNQYGTFEVNKYDKN